MLFGHPISGMEGHLRTQIRVICTHRPGSSVHAYRVHLYTQSCLGMGWGGVGWANNVHVPVHTHTANLIIFLLSSRHRHLSGDGVGWGDNVHVPGTATLSSFLLSCRHRHYSWLISYRWVGWGRVITFMFLCTHRHTKPLD